MSKYCFHKNIFLKKINKKLNFLLKPFTKPLSCYLFFLNFSLINSNYIFNTIFLKNFNFISFNLLNVNNAILKKHIYF